MILSRKSVGLLVLLILHTKAVKHTNENRMRGVCIIMQMADAEEWGECGVARNAEDEERREERMVQREVVEWVYSSWTTCPFSET